MDDKPDFLVFSPKHEREPAAPIEIAHELCRTARELREKARRLVEESHQAREERSARVPPGIHPSEI